MAHKTYTARRMIQFAHCDPAGIVFYPRFFDICLDVKEEFMEHVGFAHHHSINTLKVGWPIVRLETDFKKPCRYADHIEVDINLWRLGDASMGLQYRFRGDDGERLLVRSVIVRMSLETGKPLIMPPEMKAGFGEYLLEQT